MKKPAYLILALFLTGCLENTPDFIEPQPADTKNLSSFPNKITGDYRGNDEDNITITRNMVLQWGFSSVEMSKKEIEANKELIIVNDTLIDLKENEKIPVRITSDSVYGTIHWKDTAFTISDKKKYLKIE